VAVVVVLAPRLRDPGPTMLRRDQPGLLLIGVAGPAVVDGHDQAAGTAAGHPRRPVTVTALLRLLPLASVVMASAEAQEGRGPPT